MSGEELRGRSQALSAVAARRKLPRSTPILPSQQDGRGDPSGQKRLSAHSAETAYPAVSSRKRKKGRVAETRQRKEPIAEVLSQAGADLQSSRADGPRIAKVHTDSSSRGQCVADLESGNAGNAIWSTYDELSACSQWTHPERKTLHLTFDTPQKIVVLGSYGIKITRGTATVFGGTLGPGDAIAWVHAPATHPIPPIRTSGNVALSLHSHPSAEPLRKLKAVSRLFGRLWDETVAPGGQGNASFRVLFRAQYAADRPPARTLTLPASWVKTMDLLCESPPRNNAGMPTPVVVCGPQGSGKSTFAKALCNALVTAGGGSSPSSRKAGALMYLDLDPGQSEFSPPGFVSLIRITGLVADPSFTHPLQAGNPWSTVRSHAIASFSFGANPELYMQCAGDLISAYHASFSECALVVNTAGWIQGTGLDALVGLIPMAKTEEVIFLSEEDKELSEACDALAAAGKNAQSGIRIRHVDSFRGSGLGHPTKKDLRQMQNLSYFHASACSGVALSSSWDPAPLHTRTPLEVRYSGPGAGILGIVSYEHQLAPEVCMEAINGSILCLVEVESPKAFERMLGSPSGTEEEPIGFCPRIGVPSRHLVRSAEHLPFINNPNSTFLDPAHSQALGLVLVRGIDVSRKTLQLLTPIPLSRIRQTHENGRGLVLVLGKLDGPIWAYVEALQHGSQDEFELQDETELEDMETEEDGTDSSSTDGDQLPFGAEDALAQARMPGSIQKLSAEEESADSDGGHAPVESELEYQTVPWVETLRGEQRRAEGSRALRSKRHLVRPA